MRYHVYTFVSERLLMVTRQSIGKKSNGVNTSKTAGRVTEYQTGTLSIRGKN